MVQFNLLLSLALAASSVFALPQGLPTPPSNSNSTGGANGTALSESVLSSIPLQEVSGDSSAEVIQASNTTLVEAQPEIASQADATPPDPLAKLKKRAVCTDGFGGSPLTAWSNVLFLSERVCDLWFPNGATVSWLPVPLTPPKIISGPLSGSLITFTLRTAVTFPPTDLFTPMTNAICKARYATILDKTRNNPFCPGPSAVHAGSDCDESDKAACFEFKLT